VSTPPPPTRPGIPLKDRHDPGAAPASSALPRHCWVTGPADAPGPWPGVLTSWRRATDGSWQALVTYAVAPEGESTVITQWLAQGLVRPA